MTEAVFEPDARREAQFGRSASRIADPVSHQVPLACRQMDHGPLDTGDAQQEVC
jgi:hypothetical protein